MDEKEPLLFEPVALFGSFAEHGVRYVLIGALAAVVHGSPSFTGDADICPARDRENLERLAAALRDLRARIREPSAPEGLAFSCDAESLGRMRTVNLVTPYGMLDLCFEPAGFSGYEELAPRAITYSIGGVAVPVASLRDVIHSKETANRPKDHAVLPVLYALEDEIARREHPTPGRDA